LEETGHHSHFLGHYPSYKISKTAINMYTRTLALRLKDQVTVSSVNPGWVKTDMGGEDADITPEEATENIFKFAISKPDSGLFWFNGEMMPW
jgi:NAD(P)-dependent dehydrogenase (short-subunit alcohol dehydrogenase family)